MEYALVSGNNIKSHSPLIHHLIASLNYQTLILNKSEFDTFMSTKSFKGLNITIPYKKDVINYLDEIDELAKSLGVVNTVVNQNGKLIGYNTDYYGFSFMLDYFKVDVKDKKVIILGSGATSNTVELVLKNKKAKTILKVSRRKTGPNIISYNEIYNHQDVDVIVNTTPVKDVSIIDFNKIKPSFVIDVNYNPLYSRILVEAKMNKIKVVNGLMMLVAQAFLADELFLSKKLDPSIILKVYKKVKSQLLSIALIGLSYSGKTTLAKEFANKYGFNYIDTDEEIEKLTSLKIRDIFKNHGEDYFREIESKIVKDVSLLNHSIISLGGGVILNKENIINLASNCVIVHLTRDVKQIKLNDDRPLIKDKDDLVSLNKKRYLLYEQYSDVTIINNGTIEDATNKIKEVFNEYLSY